jgi:CHAD domain-containing protein
VKIDSVKAPGHVRAALAAQLAEIVANEPGTRLGKDPECLHRMRVATRRARSTLRVAGPLFDEAWSADLRVELSWLGDVLGGVRDLDVLSAHLRSESQTLEPAEAATLQPVFSRLSAERSKARASLTRALNGKRYASLLARLEEAATSPPHGTSGVELESRAATEFGKLVESMKSLGSEPTDEELHRARIRGKRARYAAELAAPLAARSPKSFIKKAKEFQDVVGAHQDAVVAEEKLRVLAASDGPAFAAGRLVERERERKRLARLELPGAWSRLHRAGKKVWR